MVLSGILCLQSSGHLSGPPVRWLAGINVLMLIMCWYAGSAQDTGLQPGSVFREYSFKKMVSPFKGEYAAYDSFEVKLDIDDLSQAVAAELAVNFWGGHIGTSDQVFKVNHSGKFHFPQPDTPGNPYCYFRFGHGNPPVKVPVALFKEGQNVFTFFCGPQVCHSFNWPLYWLNSFTVRVFYASGKRGYVRGMIEKKVPGDRVAYNHVGLQTQVQDPAQVKSVEYIGYYEDYDHDGDGSLAGWQYMIEDGEWHHIVGKEFVSPYSHNWNNNWVPEQDNPIQVVAKINSESGLSYITDPITFDKLKQRNSVVKLYTAKSIGEYFGSRVSKRRECSIVVPDDLSNAVSAYLVLSSWSGESEDGALHSIGINGTMVAESPGKLHDVAFHRIPVPLDRLKTGDNLFYVYSETEEHMFEVNYPGPALLIRFRPPTSVKSN